MNKNLGKIIIQKQKKNNFVGYFIYISNEIEPNQITDMKKEKTDEIKHKQSINTNTSRTSDESNITVRSISGNPKETPRKIRRATTDNGRPKVSSI